MARILIAVNIPRFFLSHRLPVALAARDAGHEVHIATAAEDAPLLDVIRSHGFPVHPLPLQQHGTRPLAELRTLLAFIRLLHRVEPDIAHLVTIKPILYGGLAARLHRRTAIVAAMSGLGRGMRPDSARLPKLLLRPWLRLALPTSRTRMVFQNQEDREHLIGLGLTDASRSVVVKGSGVDPARFSPSPEPTDAPPVVLFAGRLMRAKGFDDFVHLARELRGDARFVVAGYVEPTSPDAVAVSELEAHAADGTLEWWGRREDMPDVIAAANVVVLPSSYGEGVPKVLIEAAASGRPIVTTDTPGCRDICQDGVNGLLVAAGDRPALVEATRRLVSDADLRRRMGRAGRQRFEGEYTLEQVLAGTLRVYESLMRPTRTRTPVMDRTWRRRPR